MPASNVVLSHVPIDAAPPRPRVLFTVSIFQMPTNLRAILLRSAVALMLAGRLSAQSSTGVIEGVVTDEELHPLPDATVTVGSSIRVTTSESGRFQIVGVPPGQYIVLVRRLGFTPATTIVQLMARDTLRPSFMLERSVSSLDTVKVTGRFISPKLKEFEDRRKLGEGQFMTAAQIEQRNPIDARDLLRTFLGIEITKGEVFNRRVNAAYGKCPLSIYVDGIRLYKAALDRDLPSPKDFAGVEVYTGPATIPLQYKSLGGSDTGKDFCGVILFWTKDGSELP
jgi:hypothetical protein